MREKLLKELEEAIRNELGDRYAVHSDIAVGNNGDEKESIVIRPKGSSGGYGFYVDKELSMLETGMISVQDMAEEIANEIPKVYKDNKLKTVDDFVNNLTKEEILEKVVYKLINRDMNINRLKIRPHRDKLNLTAVYKVCVHEDEKSSMGFIMVNELCREYGISIAELDEAARRNTLNRGFNVIKISDVLKEMDDAPESMVYDGKNAYVITNDRKCDGACVMLFDEYFAELADKLNDDLYVIPSSVHEVITVPAEEADPEKITNTVMLINATGLNQNEILSNNIYKYDRNARELKLVETQPI